MRSVLVCGNDLTLKHKIFDEALLKKPVATTLFEKGRQFEDVQ